MRIVYQIVLALLLCLGGPFLLLGRGAHYLPTLPGRFTFHRPPRPEGAHGEAPLWIHAVSVGEVAVAATLVRELPAATPLLVTTVTPTGQKQAEKALGERPATTCTYLPFDLGWTVRRFLDHYRPCALLLVEGEQWPVLLSHVGRRGLPIAVINGRLGDRSWKRWQRGHRWGRPFAERVAALLFGNVDRFGVQTGQDRDRFTGLGIPDHRLEVTGNIKFDAPADGEGTELEARLQALAAGRPILVAGSTMQGEEPHVLDAFRIAGGGERALLVLAPRHRERWDEVARWLDDGGWRWLRRSRLAAEQAAAPERPAVVLLDSYGELASLYRIAAAAFVGGTLVDTGGHNPVEPARFGVPIAIGPSMTNFRDMAAQFDDADAWRRVADADELGRAWGELLDDPEQARAVGDRARRLVEENRGAVGRTLTMLAPLLGEAP